MDDAALFALSTRTALRGLARNRHLLDVVARQGEAVLGARLADGQFALGEQIEIATGFALRCVMPCIGQSSGQAEGARSVESLGARMTDAARRIAAVTEADFDGASGRMVRHRAGDAVLTQDVTDYLLTFAIPNLWFHISMAYAVLRAEGVAVGKADFDGLHSYPEGFSFV